MAIESIDLNYKNKKYDPIVNNIIFNILSVSDIEPFLKKDLSSKEKDKILKELNKLKKYNIVEEEVFLEIKNYFTNYFSTEFIDYILDYIVGYKELSEIMKSDDYEEIMINDYKQVFILSRKNRFYKTNITFDKISFNIFLEHIKKTLKKDFTERDFIDGILPDGSRINIVSTSIAKFNVITIRKHLKNPITIVDLIKNNTIDYEIGAYLWTITEGFNIKPANLFICGGTSTGKTTFLNVLLQFVSQNVRVIGVEDTKEVDLSIFKNNVSLTSNISDEDSLYNITVNILRMRPDRIIIGEARGKEVKGLFLAMDTGHNGCISTMHANNSADLINKLSSHPMNVEDVYIKLLDVIITFNRKVVDNKIYRYISEISEIHRMGNITINHIYKNENMNSNNKINIMASSFLENLCKLTGISKIELQVILEKRADVLRMIVNRGVSDQNEIRDILTDSNFSYKNLLNR